MLQVTENDVENTHYYSYIYQKYKSEYKNKNCDSKVAVQFVQTYLPEIKTIWTWTCQLGREKKTKKQKQHLQRNAKHEGSQYYTTKTG